MISCQTPTYVFLNQDVWIFPPPPPPDHVFHKEERDKGASSWYSWGCPATWVEALYQAVVRPLMADVEGRCDRAAVRILATWVEDLLVWTKVQIGSHETHQSQKWGCVNISLFGSPWKTNKALDGKPKRNISQCVRSILLIKMCQSFPAAINPNPFPPAGDHFRGNTHSCLMEQDFQPHFRTGCQQESVFLNSDSWLSWHWIADLPAVFF